MIPLKTRLFLLGVLMLVALAASGCGDLFTGPRVACAQQIRPVYLGRMVIHYADHADTIPLWSDPKKLADTVTKCVPT